MHRVRKFVTQNPSVSSKISNSSSDENTVLDKLEPYKFEPKSVNATQIWIIFKIKVMMRLMMIYRDFKIKNGKILKILIEKSISFTN